MKVGRVAPSRLGIATVAAAGAFVVLLALFAVRPLVPIECAYAAPILCAELPPSGAELHRVLSDGANERGAWVWNLAVDMPFLIAYAALLALTAASFEARFARIVMIAPIAAAAFDIAENTGIYLAIGGSPSDVHALFVRSCAHAKFALLFAACAGITLMRARDARSRMGRASFIVIAALCVLGLAGPLHPMVLQIAALGMTLAFVYAMVRAVLRLRRT